MFLNRLIDTRLGWISVTPQSYLAPIPGPVTTVHLPNELAARLSASTARHGVGVDDVTYMVDNDV